MVNGGTANEYFGAAEPTNSRSNRDLEDAHNDSSSVYGDTNPASVAAADYAVVGAANTYDELRVIPNETLPPSSGPRKVVPVVVAPIERQMTDAEKLKADKE